MAKFGQLETGILEYLGYIAKILQQHSIQANEEQYILKNLFGHNGKHSLWVTPY